MPRPLLIFSQSDYLIQIVDTNSNTEWQTVHIQISWLLQKPTDLDLHCLQRQGISGFSRIRVNLVLLSMLGKNCCRHFEVFFLIFSQEIVFDISKPIYREFKKKKWFVGCWIFPQGGKVYLYHSQVKLLRMIFLFFPENRILQFIQIVPNGDSLHEMSKPAFWEK